MYIKLQISRYYSCQYIIRDRVHKSFYKRTINVVQDDNDVAVDINSVCRIFFVFHAITNVKKDGSRNNTVNE